MVIEKLVSHQLKVVTIKHHGHHGKPSVLENKDSSQYIIAGAHTTLVEGNGHLLIHAEQSHWPLSKKSGLYLFFNPMSF